MVNKLTGQLYDRGNVGAQHVRKNQLQTAATGDGRVPLLPPPTSRRQIAGNARMALLLRQLSRRATGGCEKRGSLRTQE